MSTSTSPLLRSVAGNEFRLEAWVESPFTSLWSSAGIKLLPGPGQALAKRPGRQVGAHATGNQIVENGWRAESWRTHNWRHKYCFCWVSAGRKMNARWFAAGLKDLEFGGFGVSQHALLSLQEPSVWSSCTWIPSSNPSAINAFFPPIEETTGEQEKRRSSSLPSTSPPAFRLPHQSKAIKANHLKPSLCCKAPSFLQHSFCLDAQRHRASV